MSHSREIHRIQQIGESLRRSPEWLAAKMAYREAPFGSAEESEAFEQMNDIAAKFYTKEADNADR